MPTNIYIDTEFHEDGARIDLISLGAVNDKDASEFYGVSRFARIDLVPEWHQKHVLPQLPHYGDAAWMHRRQMASAFNDYVQRLRAASSDGKVAFWGFYSSYDFVCVAQLYHTMLEMPDGMPRYCMDLKQLSVMLGGPESPPKPVGAHDALVDARWNRDLHKFLRDVACGRGIGKGDL